MASIFGLSGWLSEIMAALAKVLLALMIVLVVVDVLMRNLGGRPLTWGISVAEYILLYVTFLSMPRLVRQKGHVFVEFLRFPMTPRMRLVLEKLVYLGCTALCVYLGWYAVTSLVTAIAAGSYETRVFDMPKWAVFLPIASGFALATVEWLRFLLGTDSMYDYDPLEVGGH